MCVSICIETFSSQSFRNTPAAATDAGRSTKHDMEYAKRESCRLLTGRGPNTLVAWSLPMPTAEVRDNEIQRHQKTWRGNPGTVLVCRHHGGVWHDGPGTISELESGSISPRGTRASRTRT